MYYYYYYLILLNNIIIFFFSATPGAFLGHAVNRNEEDFIATWLAPNITSNPNYDR